MNKAIFKKKTVWRSITCLCFSLLFCSTMAFGQNFAVTGTVTDIANDPLPGTNVTVKGTTLGTMTDADGKYTLNVPGRDAVLVFSYIGFVTYEQTVGDQRVINVKLSEDSRQIDEVVVVAYGVQKKETLTGALSTIGTTELVKAPVPNVAHALAGNLSGLSAIQYSGQPGVDDPTIFIRGQGSLDADRSAPLFMVDGVERSFFRLDPNEIESITILKDASATAVFGVRGANGVILVTTKRGQVGAPKISVTTSAGLQHPIRLMEYNDSYTWASMFNEAQMNDGMTAEQVSFQPKILEAFRTGSDPLLYPNTDWMGMFVKPSALQTQHNVNISGGTENVRYFTSIGVLTQDGIYRSFDDSYNANWQYNRFNYRANLDIDVTKSTLLRINLGGRAEKRHEPNIKESTFWNLLQFNLPFSGVGLYEGKWVRSHSENVGTTEGTLENGDVFEMIYGRGYNDRLMNNIALDVILTQTLDVITKGLSFTMKGSYNNSFEHQKTRGKGEAYYTPHRNPDTGELFFRKRRDESIFGFSESLIKDRNWYLEASLNYARKFGRHNVTALALYNQHTYPYGGLSNNPYPAIPRGFVGFVGRVTYDYNSRYMMDFNVGYNGSENFPPGKRYGLFPAMSAGWILSEENFMQGISFLNYLKVRASYGLVGNDRYSGGRFFYLPDAYNPSNGGYNFGTTVSANQPAATELRLGNKNVTWETARKQNYAIDFTVWDSRLSASVDYFIEKRDNILISRSTIPGHIAVSMPVMNLGKTENKGIEFTLKWNQKINDFRYNIGVNTTLAKGKVIYKDEIPRNYAWRYETGKPIDQHFGYVFDGFVTAADVAGGKLPDHKVELKPGDAKYKDLNEDGVIDDDDISAIGYSRWPQLAGGFNAGFEYKNFDFSMMWAGASRVSRYLSSFYRIPFGETRNRGTMKYMYTNHWTPETAETATTPRLTFNNADNNYRNSTLWLRDASYLRLKNLQIGYTFRSPLLKKIGMNDVRLYANGENLLTFDYIKYFDPEATDGSRFEYPMLMVVNFGININF